jgi:dipeptidase
LPVSYPLVKNESEYASSNIGFLDHLVLPLFQGITEISPNFSSLCERVAQNRAYWAKKTIKEA